MAALENELFKRIWLLVLLSGCLLTTGCRTPWRQQMTSPEPDFNQLIEIEQAAIKRKSAPLVRHMKDDNQSTRYASAKTSTSDRSASTSELLETDAEYQTALAQANGLEREMLERSGNAMLSRLKQNSQGEVAKREPKGPAGEPGDTPVAFHLSDTGTSPEQENAATPDLRREGPSANGATTRQIADDRIPGELPSPRTESDGQVVTASFSQPQSSARAEEMTARELSAFDTRELAHALANKLEVAKSDLANPDEQVDLAKKRRLINLVLDDLESAQEPIEGMQPDAQDYVRYAFHGLHDATDIQGNPVASRRFTLALQNHRKAADSLSKLANLEVLSPCFCTEVESFGLVTKFPQNQFRPDQEVLLYCELENFVSEPVRGGFETQLQGSYEIVDSQGRRVADQLLPEDTDTCGRKRRDFYIAYRLHLPEKLEPGPHKLKLTIEDMKGHKFGQATLDFQAIR